MARKPSAIISLADFQEPKNILVYGDAGVGKTPFGASCPNALILATEAGTVSAYRLGHSADVWPCIDSWDEFVKAFRWLADGGYADYDWVVVDNATQLQENMLRAIVALARKNNSNRDEDIPAIQDYQKWYLMFDRFVKSLNNLPVNTLWLAHTMRKSDQEGDDIVLPAIQGQDYAQASKFCGRMQAIGYMEYRTIKKGNETVYQRRIRWRKNQTYFAKDRYLFQKDDSTQTFTTAAEGDIEKTDMAEISRRIDAALKAPKPAVTRAPARPAKKATPTKTATATRRRAAS